MLAAIGAPSLESLFDAIPEKLRLARPLDLPASASEQEALAELAALAARNACVDGHDGWFLGAGTYAHYIPSAIDALAGRAEFYTSYTPYQPEISQGTLQAIFEWQTMVCALTGMDVSNASLYDGASAAAEAALLAMRATRRHKIVTAGLHPHYRDVVRTYVEGPGGALVEAPRAADGRSARLRELVDGETACLLLQQPSFLGCVEDVRAAAEAAHAHGALLAVAVSEALSLALLRAPGELGADVVCGEAQSFGVPMAAGGPHLGFLAVREKLLRQMPGRVCGETVDARGRRGFVLTLSTREQHIRRERATSNICTNQGLMLLRATIYLALLGRHGLPRLARTNLAKARYLRERVAATPGLSLPLAAPSFHEFVIGLRAGDSADAALARARDDRLLGGLDLAAFAPELGPALLVCATELASRDAMDRLARALGGTR
jgi:glycine dehydrogenase subunit 1